MGAPAHMNEKQGEYATLVGATLLHFRATAHRLRRRFHLPNAGGRAAITRRD